MGGVNHAHTHFSVNYLRVTVCLLFVYVGFKEIIFQLLYLFIVSLWNIMSANQYYEKNF